MAKLDTSKTEWDFSILLGENFDDEAERKEIRSKVDEFVKKWKSGTDYLEDPKVLKEALDDYNELFEKYMKGGNYGYYLWLATQKDQNNSELKAKYNKQDEFEREIANEIRFFDLNLGKVSSEIKEKFLVSPELEDYRHYLKRIFDFSKYLLSEGEEKIISMQQPSAYSNWIKMVSGFLSSEERKVLIGDKKELQGFSEILGLFLNKDKKVRDSAAEAFNDILKKWADLAENEINSVLSNKKALDKIRGYESSDKARHLSDDIDTDVVNSLVDSVSGRFDLPKRFYELKAKLLGLDKLDYHDRVVPYGDLDKDYSYDDAVDLVHESLTNLDSEFGDIFKMFVEKGHIDVRPEKGKSGGAFCAYSLKNQPVFILLNHTNKLTDVKTLAHETGHGINDELMRKQKAVYFGTSLSTAEVASTFMEDFSMDKLREEADEELKLALMVKKLDDEVGSIFRQIACYNFERDLHQGIADKGYLSKEEIGKIFSKNMASYMGDYVEQSPGSENWWVYWSHIRRPFYVYSYSSGLLISKYLQRKVREDKKFVEKVKEFLSAGESKSPKDIFMEMGIDISRKEFWEEGIKDFEDLLNETEKLAKKLGKI